MSKDKQQVQIFLEKAAQLQAEKAFNFCPRCGKRLPTGFVEISIHTCTPPIATGSGASDGFPPQPASSSNAGGKCVTVGETTPVDPNAWAFENGLESS